MQFCAPTGGCLFRRCFRFSLRTLIVVVTLSGVWLGKVVHDARQRQDAIARVVELGGTVGYYCPYDDFGNSVPPPPSNCFTAWLDTACGDYFATPKAVCFPTNCASERALEAAEHLPELEIVSLSNATPSDAVFSHLKGLRNLKFILCNFEQISDMGFRHIHGLTGLRWLDVRGSRISEKGLIDLTSALPTTLIKCYARCYYFRGKGCHESELNYDEMAKAWGVMR